MRKPLILFGVVALLVLAFVAYRSGNKQDKLNMEPNAAREIEKAKRR